MPKDAVTHAHIVERIEGVQRELTDAKNESKQHRDDMQKRLRDIEQKIAGLGGGWKVLMILGGLLTSILAAIASTIAIMKGLK